MENHTFEVTDKLGERHQITFVVSTEAISEIDLVESSNNEIEVMYRQLSHCEWVGKSNRYQNKTDAKTGIKIFIPGGNLDIISIDFSKCKKSGWNERKYALIHEIRLDPCLQRLRIGSKVVQELEKILKSEGIEYICGSLPSANEIDVAKRFWRSVGYRINGMEIYKKLA